VFGGYACMRNACCECGAASARCEPFAALAVEVDRDTHSIEDALARRAALNPNCF
jgi:ubiquitin C-terminal hydrolase